MALPFYSIVIPFHNEEDSLRELIPRLTTQTLAIGRPHEILFVDDGSTDKGQEIIKEHAQNNENIKLLSSDSQLGQTESFRIAFQNVQGQFTIRMDADLQDSPEDLPLFLEKIDQGAELVMGLRECRRHSRILRVASGVYDLLVVLLLNSPFHSSAGSFVAFKTELIRDIPMRKHDHRFFPIIALERGAKNEGEIFVQHNARRYGQSKYNVFRKLLFGIPQVLIFLFRLKTGAFKKS